MGISGPLDREVFVQTPAKAGPGAASRFGHGHLSLNRRAFSARFSPEWQAPGQRRLRGDGLTFALQRASGLFIVRAILLCPACSGRRDEPIERSIDDGKNQ
jgi:hypothetical protein